MANTADVREGLKILAKGGLILFVAIMWIWTLYPLDDVPIVFDATVDTAMAQSGITIIGIATSNRVNTPIEFPGKTVNPSFSSNQFIDNVKAEGKGMVLTRIVVQRQSLRREFFFLPENPAQKIQSYAEDYNPPPSYFAYDIEENEGAYYFGKEYFFVFMAAMFTLAAYIMVAPRRQRSF